MYRKIFKLTVTTISILAVNLLTTKITDYLVSYKTHARPLTFTLIAMAIICLIFYPLFTRLEDWINVISTKIVRTGRSVIGKYIALIVMFFVSLIVLMYFFAKMWYDIDLFRMLFDGSISSQF
jgi:hypothetical protein